MRLRANQVQAIHHAIQNILGNSSYELFLYGSRAKSELQGGDIDLALSVGKSDKETAKNLYFSILTEIKKQNVIGDRRIDLKIFSPEEMVTDDFIQKISREWIKI